MASELQVTTLRGVPTGANANQIVVPSGQTLAAPGHVIQMKNVVMNTNTVITSTSSFSDITGASITITPKYANSKILIQVVNHVYTTEFATVHNWRGSLMRLLRDTTEVYGDPGGSYGEGQLYSSTSERWMTYRHDQYVDSPQTTNAITYKMQAISKAGNNMYCNRPDYGAGGSMVVMEIAQ